MVKWAIHHLQGKKCILLPYLKDHVQEYHEWMTSPQLLEQTASEPLTLEEEYQMQQTWTNDPYKFTFIIGISQREIIGDVNLFLYEWDDDDAKNKKERFFGEIEIMIAKQEYRNKGIAIEAIQMFLKYLKNVYFVEQQQRYGPISTIIAKISKENIASQALFEKKLHFQLTKYEEAFEEYHYKIDLNSFETDNIPLEIISLPTNS